MENKSKILTTKMLWKLEYPKVIKSYQITERKHLLFTTASFTISGYYWQRLSWERFYFMHYSEMIIYKAELYVIISGLITDDHDLD